MSYTITYSNGKVLATVADQTFDNVSTSLTIVGKNSNAYGESINNNLVHLLENFANVSEPRSPMTGQLWYNTVAGRMYVYTTSSFKPVGSPIIAAARPSNLVAGDLWIDTEANKLWWYNGTDLIGSGKDYSDVTGEAGWVLETVIDAELTEKNVASLYNNGVLIAVLSDTTIPLNNSYCGTATIKPGLTLNANYGGLRFIGTATSAESILDPATGLVLRPSDFFRRNTTATTTAPIEVRLNGDGAINVGENNNLQLLVDTATTGTIKPAVIQSFYPDAKLDIRVMSSADGTISSMTFDGYTGRIGIRNRTPVYDLDVTGDMRVTGNLVVNGGTTYITSQDLRINDKNIDLAYPAGSLDDAGVNGGGIILHGTSDHSWIYNNGAGYKCWETEDNINLVNADKTFKIAGNDVISQNSLGLVITDAPGLVNLPIMPQVRFSRMTLSGNTVTTIAFPITDLVLDPSGNVNVNEHRVTNVGAPTVEGDAATKKYVDDEILLNAGGFQGRKPYTISMDVTNFLNVNQDIKSYLDLLLPVDGGAAGVLYSQPDGAACTVLATTYTATTATFFLDLNKSHVQVGTGTNVVSDVAGSVMVTTPMPIPSHEVKLYQVSSGTWVFIGNVS